MSLLILMLVCAEVRAQNLIGGVNWTLRGPSAGLVGVSPVTVPSVYCPPGVMPSSPAVQKTSADMRAITNSFEERWGNPRTPAQTAPSPSPSSKAGNKSLAKKLIEEALYGRTCPTTKSGRKVCESVCRKSILSPDRGRSHMAWRGDKIADGAACEAKFGGRPSQLQCASWVRLALERAGIKKTPGGLGHAKSVGPGLEKMGFTKCTKFNSKTAPAGAVIVYGGGQWGHVEIRTEKGYVSDYFSTRPRDSSGTRPLMGVYVLGGCS